MKKIFVIILFVSLLSAMSGFAQNKSRAVYGELFGASGVGVNYDARFIPGKGDGFGYRTGLGVGFAFSSAGLSFEFTDDKVLTYNREVSFRLPLEVNYLLGKGSSKFEAGVGAALSLSRLTSDDGAAPKTTFGVAPYLGLGYRLVTSSGFLLRLGVLPSVDFEYKTASLYPYIGLGYAF